MPVRGTIRPYPRPVAASIPEFDRVRMSHLRRRDNQDPNYWVRVANSQPIHKPRRSCSVPLPRVQTTVLRPDTKEIHREIMQQRRCLAEARVIVSDRAVAMG